MEMDVEANLKIFADFLYVFFSHFLGHPHAYSIPAHVPAQPQLILPGNMQRGERGARNCKHFYVAAWQMCNKQSRQHLRAFAGQLQTRRALKKPGQPPENRMNLLLQLLISSLGQLWQWPPLKRLHWTTGPSG